MKKLTLFLFALLVSCSAWAVNIPAETKLYLKPNSNWTQANARFAAYFFGGTANTWVSMSKVSEASSIIYEVTTPNGTWTNVIFCRMNPSASANNWNNKWNQTGDLTFDGTNDLFTIPNGNWDGSTTSWSKCFTLTYETKNDYSVGEYYIPNASCTNLKSKTFDYKVNGTTVTIPSEGYLFENGGTYEFTIEANGDNTVRATATHSITITPTVQFNNIKKEYTVGDKFTPEVNSEKILAPTYSYKLNGEPITFPEEGYLFKETGDYKFTVEVKNNGEENIVVSKDYTITVSVPKVLYLKPNANWKVDNARFAVYFFGNGEKWVDMIKLSDDLYVVNIPTDKNFPNVIFCRMTPTATANNWNNKWNQTSDLKNPDDGTNFYTVTEGAWDKGGGSWSTYIPTELTMSGDFGNMELTVENKSAFKSITSAFEAGTYDVVINDGTRYWQNVGSVTIDNIVPTIDFSVDATTKEITITPKNTFSTPSDLVLGTIYNQLEYRLAMTANKWYWVSFPFNVNISDIRIENGNKNTIKEDLVLTEYNAQVRAEKGSGGWQNVTETTLSANKGYVIGPSDNAWKASNGKMVVTFPSDLDKNEVKNSLELNTKPTEGGKEQNANWHIVGTGLYHSTTALENVNYIAVPDNNGDYIYYYVNAPAKDLFQTPFSDYTFKPFEAFFVQHGGTYIATADKTKSAAELAPVARAKAQQQEQIYLINMNEAHTVVILNAEGSEGYTVGQDFLEMNSNGNDLIYSFDGSDALAFNHRAIEAQSITLGGYVAVAGEQTISLKGYNAKVESVTLIDNLTGETADLLAGNYTFTAEVGSLDGRFTVVFGAPKAGNTTVDCYNSTANQLIAYGSANACTVSGLTTGEAVVVYNAMGQLVFATIADSETITLPSLTTGNYLILHNGTTNKVALR